MPTIGVSESLLLPFLGFMPNIGLPELLLLLFLGVVAAAPVAIIVLLILNLRRLKRDGEDLSEARDEIRRLREDLAAAKRKDA